MEQDSIQSGNYPALNGLFASQPSAPPPDDTTSRPGEFVIDDDAAQSHNQQQPSGGPPPLIPEIQPLQTSAPGSVMLVPPDSYSRSEQLLLSEDDEEEEEGAYYSETDEDAVNYVEVLKNVPGDAATTKQRLRPHKMRMGCLLFYFPGPRTVAEMRAMLRIDGIFSAVIAFVSLVGSSKAGSEVTAEISLVSGHDLAVIRSAVAFGILAALFSAGAALLAFILYFALSRLHRATAFIALTKTIFTGLAAVFAAMETIFMIASPSEYVAKSTMAFSCGIITVPFFFVFLAVEIYYIFVRPRLALRWRGTANDGEKDTIPLPNQQQQQPTSV